MLFVNKIVNNNYYYMDVILCIRLNICLIVKCYSLNRDVSFFGWV